MSEDDIKSLLETSDIGIAVHLSKIYSKLERIENHIHESKLAYLNQESKNSILEKRFLILN